MDTYNKQEAAKARKRRAVFYRLHVKGLTIFELSRRYRVSYERMRQQIRRAEEDAK